MDDEGAGVAEGAVEVLEGMLDDIDDEGALCVVRGLDVPELALDVIDDVVARAKGLSVLPTGIVEQASVTLPSLTIVIWHLDPSPEVTAVCWCRQDSFSAFDLLLA